ncbi:PAS domain-containing sensor histidine kinase [Corticibacterium sp. UT-5YL-CI-8]|nr:PAS domain-containing sensor histidine kinase [Tianweitania sp. UT-5YL-CI-8]
MAEDLEDLYENAPCGYASLGPDGRIVKSNLTLSQWTGFSQEALLGKRLRELVNTSGAIFYETHFAPLLRMQGFFNEVALDLVTIDGATLPVLVSAAERRDAYGDLLFTRVTIFQAAERRRYERELVEAKREAERGLAAERTASELREQFVAILGHDLRNPLAAIDAGINLLQRRGFDDRAPDLLAHMRRSGSRMQELINNVLDLTRSRLGGGIPLKKEECSITPVMAQVIEELRIAHPESEFAVNLNATEPVDCDQGRIGQLLSNLLGNALHHGAKNRPIRVVAVTEEGRFTLSVANEGDPIRPEIMERLFLPFYRGEARSSAEGLGLGLYIASEIARAHDGELSVTSDQSGTVFTFTMPTARTAAPDGVG